MKSEFFNWEFWGPIWGLKIKPTRKVLVFKQLNRVIVGVTGFEPATTRPPDVYATGLRHTPMERQI